MAHSILKKDLLSLSLKKISSFKKGSSLKIRDLKCYEIQSVTLESVPSCYVLYIKIWEDRAVFIYKHISRHP